MDTKDAGRLGGQKRAANLTPEQRSEISRRASIIRWAVEKHSKRKDSTTTPVTTSKS